MVSEVLWNTVFVTGNMILSGGVRVDLVFGVEELFKFGNTGLECEPVSSMSKGDARCIDPRSYEPCVDYVDRFLRRRKKLDNLEISSAE